MRLITLCFLLAIIASSAIAQTRPRTKVYFFNSAQGGIRGPVILQNPSDKDNPIKLENKTCVSVELVTDSLSLMVNGGTQSIYFAPGQNYYYIVYEDYFPSNLVLEVTERVFWITATLNGSKKLQQYTLGKSGN